MAAIMDRLPKQLQAAINAHRSGDFDTAGAGYRKFLRRHDREAGVWHLLASAQLMCGKLVDAREAAEPRRSSIRRCLVRSWRGQRPPPWTSLPHPACRHGSLGSVGTSRRPRHAESDHRERAHVRDPALRVDEHTDPQVVPSEKRADAHVVASSVAGALRAACIPACSSAHSPG